MRPGWMLLGAFLLVAPAWAGTRESGVQISPDGRQVLVNKDVGSQRWAIARNVGDDTVTGNVFLGAGEDPIFVWCDELSRDAEEVMLECHAADPCGEAPCTPQGWTLVGPVSVPLSFFEPPGAPSCTSHAACGVGEYCRRSPGACGEPGTCAERPQICPVVVDPVCGCDGKTYDNACDAAGHGENVAHEGACQVTCEDAGDCGLGQYCERPEGSCAGSGVCSARPMACPEIFAPVCGCDGETYGNPCEAAAGGANVAHEGECLDELAICGGIAGLTCEEDEYCSYLIGECLIPDAVGECRPKPGQPCLCPFLFDPVCGCDGQTYDNACLAACAGQSVGTVGVCP